MCTRSCLSVCLSLVKCRQLFFAGKSAGGCPAHGPYLLFAGLRDNLGSQLQATGNYSKRITGWFHMRHIPVLEGICIGIEPFATAGLVANTFGFCRDLYNSEPSITKMEL